MWTRVKESELLVRPHMRPTRVVLDKDSSREEYRTYLETVLRDGKVAFFHGRIFEDWDQAREAFDRRLKRL